MNSEKQRLDLLILGDSPAGQAGLGYAQDQGVRVLLETRVVAQICRMQDGWRIVGADWHWQARAVLLTSDTLALWKMAGGAVVRNPVLRHDVPLPGDLPGIEVAGTALGIKGEDGARKSGRFRARKLLRALDSAP